MTNTYLTRIDYLLNLINSYEKDHKTGLIIFVVSSYHDIATSADFIAGLLNMDSSDHYVHFCTASHGKIQKQSYSQWVKTLSVELNKKRYPLNLLLCHTGLVQGLDIGDIREVAI